MGKHLAIPPESRRISPTTASEIGKTGGAISPPFLFPIGRRRDRGPSSAWSESTPISPTIVRADDHDSIMGPPEHPALLRGEEAQLSASHRISNAGWWHFPGVAE